MPVIYCARLWLVQLIKGSLYYSLDVDMHFYSTQIPFSMSSGLNSQSAKLRANYLQILDPTSTYMICVILWDLLPNP